MGVQARVLRLLEFAYRGGSPSGVIWKAPKKRATML